ncbi:hypothetical protein M011DRAFT_46795 [Sporormia fimetaria CBS 119925]|uniref:Uncharacterized protein n=1 Tax=Sporormia fimetaria CBS 119925 TaxID=1340428 RepID=A0A6A6VCB0_9PLEO|nr:hypothetical protein M011DRAFT_46795 [Sporormia fimetaria CBS 119925]
MSEGSLGVYGTRSDCRRAALCRSPLPQIAHMVLPSSSSPPWTTLLHLRRPAEASQSHTARTLPICLGTAGPLPRHARLRYRSHRLLASPHYPKRTWPALCGPASSRRRHRLVRGCHGRNPKINPCRPRAQQRLRHRLPQGRAASLASDDDSRSLVATLQMPKPVR